MAGERDQRPSQTRHTLTSDVVLLLLVQSCERQYFLDGMRLLLLSLESERLSVIVSSKERQFDLVAY